MHVLSRAIWRLKIMRLANNWIAANSPLCIILNYLNVLFFIIIIVSEFCCQKVLEIAQLDSSGSAIVQGRLIERHVCDFDFGIGEIFFFS